MDVVPSTPRVITSTSTPRGEACGGADDRPRDERDHHDHDEQDVRLGAEEPCPGEGGDLEHGGQEDQRRDTQGGAHACASLDGHQDEHGFECREICERLDLDLRVQVGVGPSDTRHAADPDALRVERREPRGAPAGRDDGVADADDSLLRHTIEPQRRAWPVAGANDAGRVGREVDRRDRALVVRQERDPRCARANPADRPDEPVGSDDGVVDPNAVVSADRDDDRLGVHGRRTRDDTGREPAGSRLRGVGRP